MPLSPGVFDGPAGGPYDQRLVVSWDGAELTWAWHRAPTGDDLSERSTAVVRKADG